MLKMNLSQKKTKISSRRRSLGGGGGRKRTFKAGKQFGSCLYHAVREKSGRLITLTVKSPADLSR